MKHSVLCLILSWMYVATLVAQTHASADKLFQGGDYDNAQLEYAALLKSYPTNPLYLYRYARCAQEKGDYNTALQFFAKAGDRYMLKYFYMGECYMKLWRAEEAIESYTTYLNSLKEPNEREQHIQQQINFANKLRRYLRRVERLQIIDSVQVALDSMLQVCSLSAEAGQLTLDAEFSLVYTNQRGDRRLKAMGADSAKILVSNHRLLDEWTPADTLPNIINFTTVQQSPYLLNDGVTLYFAAKDSNGIGDLDIYVSRYNMTTETYTLPENLGMPYNSPENEYMLLLDEAKKIGYLATDRFAKKGYVHIYSFLLSQQKRYYMPSDSLVAYARLECFEKAQMIDVQSDVDTLKTEETEPITDLNLVINDTIIYHSMSDFRDPLSKEKYVEWQSLVHQLESEQQQLSELRVQYAKAEKQVQDELTTLILRLEDNQTQLRNSSNILLQEIRKIEMSAR